MNNNLLRIKINERLNKLASFDYDNIECWQIAEAFNKAQLEFIRRQVHVIPSNPGTGDEASKMQIDDLQKILLTVGITSSKKDLFYETELIPEDYLYFKRISIKGEKDCCPGRSMTVYLDEAADVDNLLSDEFKKPSWTWGETFCTMQSNRIRIYTNNEFEIENPQLTYYRKPKEVQFEGCVNPSTGALVTADVACEFKDDVVEVMIDGAVAILAGDMESFNQSGRAQMNQQMQD
jgi:hypothetical protein